jgi:RNA-directed DNA polymerase
MNHGDVEGRVAISGAAKSGSGRKSRGGGDGASKVTAKRGRSHPETLQLMEAVVERENMKTAWLRVKGNKGAAGVDGMSVDALLPSLREHWPTIKEDLLADRYQPSPVRQVEIPKPGGGMRQLGIPTVLDRLIQQALHQVLQPIFDPGFSDSSYGFRPGRGAQQAVVQAKAYVAAGKRWVLDLDLEKFFYRVNHDILMARLARKIRDKRVLRLIRRYLQAGIMESGLVSPRTEGTPQGGPLSPLLSNILLDDLDKELERRGHSFCRYADDCNTYVGSRRAGERLMASLSRFLTEKLELKVNEAKSAVDRPWRRKFLGYSMTWHKRPRLKIAPASLDRFKNKVRERLRGGGGRNVKRQIEELIPLLRGWINYFRLAEVKGMLEELDGWLRRKFRCILWRQWKRSHTRAKNLLKRGLTEERAWRSATNGRGPWWNAGASHMNEAFPKRFFDELGLVSLLDYLRLIQSTA